MAKSKRNQAKIRKILKQKGYKSGKAPKGKVAHHVKPKVKGGKDTKGNIRVISKTKHIKIHRHRREKGKI